MLETGILLLSVYNERIKRRLEDVGICYIASYLRQNGCNVKLWAEYEDQVDYNAIVEFQPFLVGLSVYNDSKDSVYRICARLKQVLPETYICVGAALPTYFDKEILEECPYIDIVVRGEGEITMVELISQLLSGGDLSEVKGLTYRFDGEVFVNENRPSIKDIDRLPFAARDLLVNYNLNIANISTSRGCIGSCTFCISRLFWKKWRGRSPGNIADEIEYVHKKYGKNLFSFVDSSFEDPGIRSNRIRELAEEILKRGLTISYFVNMRADFHRHATPQLMHLLIDSGLCGACVGVESGNEHDLKLYGKIATLEDNHKIIEFLGNYQIFVDAGFINFNPYSTLEHLRMNGDFLQRYGFANNIKHLINRYKMFRGARLYEKIKKDALLKEGKFNEYGYHFVDPRIERLANFVDEYKMHLDQEADSITERHTYYANEYSLLLQHFILWFKAINHEEAYEFARNTKDQVDKILSRHNTIFSRWFTQLLTLVENGWSDEEAMYISENIVKTRELCDCVDQLSELHLVFYTKLYDLELDAHLVEIA